MTLTAASLYLAGSNLIWAAALFGLIAAALLFWGYSRARAGLSVKAVALSLKAFALALLILCLLEPSWLGERAKPGANILLVLSDNSKGLNVADGSPESRAQTVAKLLDPELSPWLSDLARDYQLRRYSFDSRLQRLDNFAELDFTGQRSDLLASLQTLADRYANRPVAGILLLTDGISTDSAAAIQSASLENLPPIYAVPIGRDSEAQDLAVTNASVTVSPFEDAPVVVRAAIRGLGLGRERVYASLTDSAGKLISEQPVRLEGTDIPTSVRFDVKPESAGVSFYTVNVSRTPRDPSSPPPAPSAAQPNTATNPANTSTETQPASSGNPVANTAINNAAAQAAAAGEATLANNSRLIAANRDSGPYRVLYISGRPNWEYKFLSRALADDREIDLVALIRIAKQEPRFAFRGRTGETSNPLFRGFDADEQETAAEHDQPVLVRLNTADENELKGGFPVEAKDLFAFDALIIDDLEASFFAHDQMELIRRFVADRGGGLLMLGGVESFQYGNYNRTPIADALPIYLDPPDAPSRANTVYRWDITREGLLQPWARLRQNIQDENELISKIPPFQSAHRFDSIKPGASVISTIQSVTGASLPALIVQRYGRGRSAAVALGDMWRWGFTNPTIHADLDRAWRQLTRYLVADVPGRVTLESEPDPTLPAGGRRLRIRVTDESYQPLDFADITLTVQQDGSDQIIQLDPEPALDESGVFTAEFVPRGSGGYRIIATATDEDGTTIGTDEDGWAVDNDAEEFRTLTPDRALLTRIASSSGGKLIEPADLDAFSRSLPAEPAPITEADSRPLWHNPIIFLLAIACLIGEWAIRRRRALA